MDKTTSLFLIFTFLTTISTSSTHASRVNLVVDDDASALDTGGLSREKFPKAFVFGTATSAYQVEGMADKDGRGPSIWDVFISKPGLVPGNATGEVTVDQYHHYKQMQKGKIGILLDFVWYKPLTRGKADNYAAQRARDFHVGWFIHPIVYGEYPKTMQNIVGNRLPIFTKEEVKMVKGSIDYLGINQYTTYYVYDPHKKLSKDLSYQEDWNAVFAYSKNGIAVGPRAYSSWLYKVPGGLYDALIYIKEHYGNPEVILSENGMDDPGNITLAKGLKDTGRVEFYKGYLSELKKAGDDGVNIIGYFAWSLLDNFEWRLGYTSRFGIVYVDYSNLKRYPKMSAKWFKKLLEPKKN
ncbi:hypothetical protein ACFE04_010240 [Oxalis oulophora]